MSTSDRRTATGSGLLRAEAEAMGLGWVCEREVLGGHPLQCRAVWPTAQPFLPGATDAVAP